MKDYIVLRRGRNKPQCQCHRDHYDWPRINGTVIQCKLCGQRWVRKPREMSPYWTKRILPWPRKCETC